MNDSGIPVHQLPVHELSKRLENGELTSLELVENLLARIQKHDPLLGAFIDVYQEDARSTAGAVDMARTSGHAIGPLHGIPVAVKDIIDIEGRITTGGSKVWKDRRSPFTATLVRKMVEAGMIVLGKTHTVEFALGSFGTNQHMGSPKNPWDLKEHRATGGSSAGTAASVAARMAPWGIGTDTGGSVRIPSSWCGLTGLKTSVGRISVHGVLPLSHTLDTPGPMCRNVEDAAILYHLLAGPDMHDPKTMIHPVEDPFTKMQHGISGLKLARVPDSELEKADPENREAYEESLRLLQTQGAEIGRVELPNDFEEMGAHVGLIIGAEGFSYVGKYTDDPSLPVDDDVRPRIGLGKDISAKDYLLLLRGQQHIKQSFLEALDDFDALITPSTLQPALRVEDIDQSGTAAHFTRPVNLIEHCALSLPNGFTSNGLPLSLQIICAPYQEALALRIGWTFQNTTEWHLRFPGGLD